MAMENKSLVQFGYGSAEKALNTAGFITFASDTRQLFVGDGSTAVAFAGNVKDAVFADKKLTITYNDGTADAVLDFSDVASAEGVSSLLSDLRKNINENTATISKIDAAYKLADSSIRADFAAADASLRSDLVDLIEEAKSAASAAHSVVAEDSSFLTIETSTNASTGAVTYTLKTTNVASAEDLEAVREIADAAQTSEEVQEAISNKIDSLAGGDEDVDDSSFVKVAVTSSKGEVTDVTVTTTDIASAKTLAEVKGRLDTFLAGENLDETLDTLKEIQDWINGPGVNATELTEAIAVETRLREEADASIRTDFAAADSSIRKDVSAYQTSNNAAVQANATAIGEVSTNFNTHKNDADIHVTTADKAKWNAAEKNAKDYADSLASNYDASGAAASALNAAKEYANAIKVNEQEQSGQNITISGLNILVGGNEGHKDASISVAIEDLYKEVGKAANAGVQSMAVADDSSKYAAVSSSTGAVKLTIKKVAISDASSANTGLADAFDVKESISAAKSKVIGSESDASTAVTIYGAKKLATELNSAMDTRVTNVENQLKWTVLS